MIRPIPNTVGDRLRTLRRASRQTGEAVARACGISRPLLSGLETNKVKPGAVDTLKRLAAHFGVSMEYLLTGSPEPVGITPKRGQFVEEPSELLVLRFWKRLEDDRKMEFLEELVRASSAGQNAAA